VALRPLVAAMRPREWIKNAFVLPALVFSRHLGDSAYVMTALAAVACFCVLSSAVYLLNDVADAQTDRMHPLKASRPVAAGRLAPGAALLAAACLAVGGLAAALVLSPRFGAILSVYAAANVAYSLWLKRVVLLDIMLVAAGFLLRAVAGAAVIRVPISPWFVLCTFTLALFLAAIKRRQELVLLQGEAPSHRPTLQQYSVGYLDQVIAVLTGATLVCYALYAMGVGAEGSASQRHMQWTIPFVLYGLLRYLYLVYQTGAGGSPTAVVWRDRALQATVAAWLLTSVLGYYAGR
jgi:4-hydroxybenzoate polyprenyltransferase